jgi:hypothetical protein
VTAVATLSERIPVTFEGEGSGVADLTWGQREIWAAFALAGHSIGMGGSMALPPGTTVAEAVRVLRFSLQRHQALRTRFECDERGHPVRQVLHASGEIRLDCFDVDDHHDPAEFAAGLRWTYENRDFDYAVEWPIRMGVVRHRGVLTHAVVMYCHLIIDGYGLDALNRDLANLDRTTGRAEAPVVGLAPLAEARMQATPAGARISASALRYWERLLRTVGSRRFGVPDPRTPRYWQVGLTSPAMHLALGAVSARTRVESSPILLAAFAVALARITGRRHSAVRVVMSNRFRPELAESVSVVNQTGLCVIDTEAATFDEVVVRAWRSSLGAGMHAYYDPRGLKELVARLGAERGEELDLACFFNDTRRQREPGPVTAAAEPSAVTEARLRALLPQTVRRVVYQQDQPCERMFVNIADAPDTVDLSIRVDTHHVAPADLWTCLDAMESILVESATSVGAGLGVVASA